VSFANPLPWWALALIVLGAGLVAWLAYSRRTLSPPRRTVLVTLRFITLLALVLFLLRPVARGTDADARDAIVAILVDTSRSMSIEDAGGRRIDRARRIVVDRLLPALGSQFHVEVLGFGDGVAPVAPADLTAAARRSDVAGALAGIRDRYRGRAVAGLVLVSDGGDTSGAGERAAEGGPPIYTVAVGSPTAGKDREILGVTAAEAILDDSRVDLAVSAVSHGLGNAPIELRLLENGRPVDVRRVTPAAEGSPVREVFHVSPGRGTPTVYTVETPVAAGELVPENNARSTLVQPPSRTRRVLLVEGAPGFEHSFLKRAWTSDPGLEIDSVVRKGKNEQGADTFYIQAAQSRSDSLAAGYPATREALFRYDAVVLANVEAHQFTKAQLDATRSFVGERGGGLLVLGARSFLRQGLAGSALEDVLPLDLNERGGASLGLNERGGASLGLNERGGASLAQNDRATADLNASDGDVVLASGARGANRVSLTAAGEAHPVMQLAAAADDTRKRWAAVPALASIAPLGGPRPGASVLAVTSGPGGTRRALVAVQRFGEGRSMVFAGEASWRWRMLLPASDRAYDTFWKQALRWLALPASDPIQVSVEPGAAPGDMVPLRVVARNAAFEALKNVTVDVRVTSPDGRVESLRAAPDTARGTEGHYVANVRPEHAGVFKVSVDVRNGTTSAGTASASVLVGGADLEMTDPRVNQAFFERLAAASGGRVLADDRLSGLTDLLRAGLPAAALAVRRDLWHTGWSFAAILVLLGAEWLTRRRWGLR
jgi:hypothetical protein